MRRVALIAALVVGATAAPAAEAAKSYRFKADITVRQLVGWNQHFRENAWCGDDYHREYQGIGSGELKARMRGGRVTFRERGRYLMSNELRVPATRGALNQWTVQWVGNPENCPPNLPAAQEPDDGADCGPTRKGRLDAGLFVLRGRLSLLGSFDPAGANDPIPCPDPTAISGVAGRAGAAARRGVDDLIRNKRVRSIELGASVRNRKLKPKEVLVPGEGTDLISAGGDYDAMWKVKLTRIYP